MLEAAFETVRAYDNRWPIIYPPVLESRSGRDAEELLKLLLDCIRYPGDGTSVDLQHIYLPFTSFVTPRVLARLVEFYYKLQELTLAGNNIFSIVATCEILRNSYAGLVNLNLLSCEIPEEGLTVIRNIPTLDMFIHESTILPGLDRYIPPEVQGSRKSLKINFTYVSETPRLARDKLSEMMADYTFYRDKSILFRRGMYLQELAAHHPFMGPVSAISCLKELVTILSDSEFSPDWISASSFLKGIFCKGYLPEIQVGLPVDISAEPRVDFEDDDGTRLMITYWAGNIYACFSEWTNDFEGRRTLGKWTPNDYLVRYMAYFTPENRGHVFKICQRLREWCGDGFNISTNQRSVGSPSMKSSYREEIIEATDVQGQPRVTDVFPFDRAFVHSTIYSPGGAGDTDIEDI